MVKQSNQAYFYIFPSDIFSESILFIFSTFVFSVFFFFVLCSAIFSFLYRYDMVCQQITVQTVKA